VVISSKQEPAVDRSIVVDVEIDGGDVGSAVVGREDVTRIPTTADVECLVASSTTTGSTTTAHHVDDVWNRTLPQKGQSFSALRAG
jgi:hypothetical protein